MFFHFYCLWCSLTILNQWIQDHKPNLPKLFPPSGGLQSNVDEMCARFDQTLGPAVRVWVYSHLIGKRSRRLRRGNFDAFHAQNFFWRCLFHTDT